MPEMQSLFDHLHYENRKTYSLRQGNVGYLDGTALARPFAMPRAQRLIATVIVAVAVVIGAVFVNNTVIAHWREAATAEQSIAANIARESALATIPQMANLVNLDDESILATFDQMGYQMYDVSGLYESNGMTVFKIPSDMSGAEVAAMYAQGINSLDAVQGTKLLNGSWLFVSDRSGTTSIVTRYADFAAGTPDAAVQNAINTEGFDVASISESGVDDAGNTYSLGTLDAEGTLCTWKVSALPLSDMYSISGLPEGACYVGIRLTAQ